jgi:hypothetical protein
MGLAKINVRFTVDMQQFSTDMQGTIRKMQQLGTQMNAVGQGLSTFVTLPLLAAGAASVKFASDYQESVNKVDVAFGSASTSVKTFAKDSLESFGIAEGSALDAAAQYGDMATSMGINQQAASKMSTSLVGLAGDLASFKNIGIEQANTALAGIFTGETESLKKLGIVMTEANLQQFALSKGIKEQVKDMDQASKVNLRYAYIMANTTNAQGDFARTGGGAANQSRIFTESLKQLGQQFGSIILPFFTKAITYVNGIIKGFGDLSTETKGLIVVVAAVAAAIGPLMVGLGNIIGIIPKLIVQFRALQATIIANPYVAAAVGIAALAAVVYGFASSTKEAETSQQALNKAVEKGNENAVEEVGTLDKLYVSATNVKLSINERKKAVDDLQSLYPAYFGNLKDEIILNGQAKTAYDQLRDAIFNKARATAIDAELQNRANQRIQKEIELRQNIAATETEIERLRKGSNTILLQEANSIEKTAAVYISKSDAIKAQSQLLVNQQAALEKFNEDNLKSDAVLFSAKEEYLKKTGKLQENESLNLTNIKLGTDAIKNSIDALTPGSIAFYEAQISGFQKLQKEQAITNGAWLQYQNNIDAIQAKIDALTSTNVKLPKPTIDNTDDTVPEFGLQELKNQKAYYENLREMYASNSSEYAKMTDQINNTDIKIKGIEGVDEIKGGFDIVKQSTDDLAASQQRLAEIGQSVGQGVADAFALLGSNIVESLGLAKTGFDGFIGGLVQTVTKLIAMMLASSISQSIAGAAASGTATGPAAIFTTPAFIATAVSGVLAAFAAIPKFETGGIVGGSSYYGDKLLARVNSGEMILNQRQQRNLSNMINPAVTAGDVAIALLPSLDFSGDKFRVMLKKVDNKRNRTS